MMSPACTLWFEATLTTMLATPSRTKEGISLWPNLSRTGTGLSGRSGRIMSARLTGGKWLASALATLLLVAGLRTTSFDDMRIVHESEGERTEILIKEGRIVWHLDAEDWLLIDCARE